ncbi:CotH kinase family protein [Microbacterium sp.]|uniref:CotH kinase family protein n=1 Tax=Microbacterium sp. TaxID=51671 RepID=UPI0039E57EC9
MTSRASRVLAPVIVFSLLGGSLAACSVTVDNAASSESSATVASSLDAALWDSSTVHSISIDYDADEYTDMIDTYLSTGEKEWISATVVIDGQTFSDVGLKLKGNSSLRGLSTDADADLSSQNPQDLPWIIRLDKFVDGQNLEGTTELVVRGNSSQTSLNEALALELLEKAGLAAEQAVSVRLSVAGSDESLRLVIENPSDEWSDRELGSGLLYKAEAGGDYSYRGEDPASYEDVFDQEAGEDDLTPLIEFLQWINESDDAEFAEGLSDRLDVEAFATYLAFQEIVDNFDDIDGPGNNSYLYYDTDTQRMTVVNWDLNLAFGATPGGGGQDAGGGQGPGRGGGGQAPGDGGDRPERPDETEQTDMAATAAMGNADGRRGGGSNVLAERFLANDEFHALYESALERLQSELIESGTAAQLLQEWTEVLNEQASDLVSADTISQESEALAQKLG